MDYCSHLRHTQFKYFIWKTASGIVGLHFLWNHSEQVSHWTHQRSGLSRSFWFQGILQLHIRGSFTDLGLLFHCSCCFAIGKRSKLPWCRHLSRCRFIPPILKVWHVGSWLKRIETRNAMANTPQSTECDCCWTGYILTVMEGLCSRSTCRPAICFFTKEVSRP